MCVCVCIGYDRVFVYVVLLHVSGLTYMTWGLCIRFNRNAVVSPLLGNMAYKQTMHELTMKGLNKCYWFGT